MHRREPAVDVADHLVYLLLQLLVLLHVGARRNRNLDCFNKKNCIFSNHIFPTKFQSGVGGANGRTMAFCLSELGLNPGTELAFPFQKVVNLLSLSIGISFKKRVL